MFFKCNFSKGITHSNASFGLGTYHQTYMIHVNQNTSFGDPNAIDRAQLYKAPNSMSCALFSHLPNLGNVRSVNRNPNKPRLNLIRKSSLNHPIAFINVPHFHCKITR